jgi:hypothetical protein
LESTSSYVASSLSFPSTIHHVSHVFSIYGGPKMTKEKRANLCIGNSILCEKDAAIPIFAQEGMIAAAQQAAPKSFDVVERCDASHSPFISQPEWLAEKLAEAASSA